MATEDTVQSSQAERNKRIFRLQQNFIQKFALDDSASKSSTVLPSLSTTALAMESAGATIESNSISASAGSIAGTISKPEDVAPKQALVPPSPRCDSKAAQPTSLSKPPASTTDEPEKTTSAQAVFSTGELFETILLNLRVEHILVNAMRVCKEWKNMIDSSQRLQQALYFRPLPNPVEPRGEHFYEKRGECKNAIQVLENPLLRRARRLAEKFQRSSRMKGRTGESTSQHLQARQKALMRPKASWRRMLAFQPPVLNIDVEHYEQINIDAIENRRGITMRDTAGDRYLYWRTGYYPIEDLYQNMRCFKLARNISRTEYDPTDELDHGFGWQASFEIPSDAEYEGD